MSGADLQARVRKLIRPDVLAMTAYHVQDASGMIKLDAMENPYDWPGSLRDAWLASLASIEANRYPDPDAVAVKQSLRQYMTLPEDCDLLLGNGSDEIIQLLIQAVAGPEAVVMAPEPGFVMYQVLAAINRVPFVGVPLDADFEIDLPAFLHAIEKHKPAIIFLAQPNNPTGNLWSAAALRAIVEAAPGLVVFDEAYMAFTDVDHLSWLSNSHVLVMRTLSKIGLAGLRLGLLIGGVEWISEINKLRLPYNINVLTQASVVFALRHAKLLQQQTQSIREERSRLMAALSGMEMIRVYPSEANFVLVKLRNANSVFAGLKQRGVLVKQFAGHPVLADCLRLTVGTAAQNDALLSGLAAELSAQN